jgi:two-component system sensor histidine kinase KdpD
LRRTFLASLAHDFRTSLTVITGRLALLAHDNPDARDPLTAAKRLDRMMTDLVGAARIEAGSLAPALDSLDLIDVVAEAVGGLTVPQGIFVQRNVPANLPFVIGDPVLLHHIMTNLIDNALRHAATTVTLDARQEGEKALFSVSDDGPGVPEAERDRIFERFVRLEGSDRTSGSGLGLSIVKGFADAMGMTVSVDAAPSGGTRFTLAMPIATEGSA